MSVLKRQRQPYGSVLHSFSTRLPEETYNTVVEWAYQKRVTLAAGIALLISKAIEAEITENSYIREETEESGNAKADA